MKFALSSYTYIQPDERRALTAQIHDGAVMNVVFGEK